MSEATFTLEASEAGAVEAKEGAGTRVAVSPLMVPPLTPPDPAQVREARRVRQLSQEDAAMLVGLSHGARWGEHESVKRHRPINAARWELFLLKTGQHPTLRLESKIQETAQRETGGGSEA